MMDCIEKCQKDTLEENIYFSLLVRFNKIYTFMIIEKLNGPYNLSNTRFTLIVIVYDTLSPFTPRFQ